MGFFCQGAIETVEVEAVEAPMKTWRNKSGKIDLTEDVNVLKEVEDSNDAELGWAMSEMKFFYYGSGMAVWL